MSKYDYFIACRWRNRDNVQEVVDKLREAGKKVYCCIENAYDGDGIKIETHKEANPEDMMKTTESLDDWRTNPTFKEIFDKDMQAQKDSDALILVFPAGLSAHMELGAMFGMGKPCYGIGKLEKTETLYLMFDDLYETVDDFVDTKIGVAV